VRRRRALLQVNRQPFQCSGDTFGELRGATILSEIAVVRRLHGEWRIQQQAAARELEAGSIKEDNDAEIND
jgi:hypothetical protein